MNLKALDSTQEDFSKNKNGFAMDMNLASAPEQEVVIRTHLVFALAF